MAVPVPTAGGGPPGSRRSRGAHLGEGRVVPIGRNSAAQRADAAEEDTKGAGTTFRGVPVEEALADYKLALVSRCLDDREIALQKQGRAFFQISGAGCEALGLGLARSLRPGHDWFFPYYRDRALVLALGVSPTEMLLQAVGAETDPASAGRLMPCHFSSPRLHVVSGSSPVATQCLPAVGCAEAGRYIGRRAGLPGCGAEPDEVTYVSLGDGATSEGEFWESLNTACRLRLPVLFVVADNGYAISVPVKDQSPAPISELVKGFAGLSIHRVDGRRYFDVRASVPEIVASLRQGQGPALLHATVTRPYSHSSADTQSKYRPRAELDDEIQNDPIALLERALAEGGLVSEEEIATMREDARRLVAEAAAEALRAPRPDPATIRRHLFSARVLEAEGGREGGHLSSRPGDNGAATPPADEVAGALPVGKARAGPPPADEAADALLVGKAPAGLPPANVAPAGPPPANEGVAMGEAIRLALHEAMANDERVRVFGEDVADGPEELLGELEGKGGVFGTTFGLQRRFGTERCYNTPLAEANIVGRAIGQGLRGLRPVPEVQFFDYIWPAMQQLKSEAATLRWRSAGGWTCPMVLRVPIGGYLAGGSVWHSQSGASIFAHIPGLVVVMPSRARDAVGLLRTALEGDDPVLFFEHKHLLRQAYTKDPFPEADFRWPFGRGRVLQRGDDLTIVTYGATVELSRQAAATLGASIEIIDLVSITPWDKALVAESVVRTGRALVVSEDNLTCGFGAEVAAWVAENCFWALDQPVMRVGTPDTHIAYEPGLERATLPQVEDIEAAARRLLELA